MTKKSKKLGVKTAKLAVFGDESFDSNDNNKDLDQICSTIDKLTLDMLILMQQQIQEKLNIEKLMTAGELHLSKSRYIMGHKNVSALQIPTENTPNINPSIFIEETNEASMLGKSRFELKTNEKEIQDPIKWFGVLVPQDLKKAQIKFRDALSPVVNCANIQTKLHQTCLKIKQLTKLKQELLETNEE